MLVAMSSMLALVGAAAQAQEKPPATPPPIRMYPGPPAPPPPPPPRSYRGRPAVQIAGAFSHEDYPAPALREGAEGLTAVRIGIDRTGRVSQCAIVQSSGHPALDATGCRIVLERFRYRPALDERGRPSDSAVVRRIRWVLPPPVPEPVEAAPAPSGG